MKALILAGGYAKRMWPLTEHTAKAMLEVAGRPVIHHILEKVQGLDEIEHIYISTNQKFEQQFTDWMRQLQPKKFLKLVVEQTNHEGEKLGSIGALEYFIDSEKITETLLIVSGDNMFDFNLMNILQFYKKRRAPVIGLYDVKDIEIAKRMGVVQMDENLRITSFEEKPEQPKSTLISTGIYIIPSTQLDLIFEYLGQKNNPDHFGHFIAWLSQKQAVYGHVFGGRWFDIGSLESYEAAKAAFR